MKNCGHVIFGCTESLCECVRATCRKIFCCLSGNKVTSETETRHIEVGAPDESGKKHNKIKTSKYTVLTFLPKNLSEQFRRVVNFYFLIVTVIAIVIDSPVSPMTSIAPLSFMVLVTAVKQGYEDWLRHRSDNKVNNQIVQVIRNSVAAEVRSATIAPGALVRVSRGAEVPADLVLVCAAGGARAHLTTANLDGETNLKTVRVPPPLVGCTIGTLPPGIRLEVPPPTADLYTFYGRVVAGERAAVLAADHLMLRGARLRHTEWAVGVAVYTGEETKLALNSKYSGNKFSSCELAINGFQVFFITLLLLEMVGSLVTKIFIERHHTARELYLGGISHTARQLAQDFFSFLLLYYYIIPMSLYVTIELYKFIGALFIGWDEELKCDESGRPAVANTSDLNEELGQVEVLFSDKTGTLTKNQMVFKACAVGNRVLEERSGRLHDSDAQHGGGEIDAAQAAVRRFFTMLALCHSAQVSQEDMKRLSARLSLAESAQLLKMFKKRKLKQNGHTLAAPPQTNGDVDVPAEGPHPGRLEYQASSPDEKALLEAAARAGVTFLGEEDNNLVVSMADPANPAHTETQMYERLQTIDFTSERKRMSVIVRDKDGVIWLFCKGAESAVFPLCEEADEFADEFAGGSRDRDRDRDRDRESAIARLSRTVDAFAARGLRTLVVAYRVVPEEEYQAIADKLRVSSGTTAAELSRALLAFRSLEARLRPAGATAVEDRLQDGVPDAIAALRRAGLRVWVLTGDKVETAINVAQSCAHITDNDRRMYLVGISDPEAVTANLVECRRILDEPTYRDSNLVVDGVTVAAILGTPHETAFIDITMKCNAVLCCRLSPIQKAEIVKLIKNSPTRPITAAVGDGANDISMIQEAHVGFGIFGREGHQAARCADFAFTQFAMLQKTLLVLGHWYYQRLATLIHYFFYKNLVLGNIMLFFQFQSAFSTQSIYDSMYLSLFNLGFTSVPCLVLAVTEQRHPPQKLMDNPTMYRLIARNRLMRWRIFFAWLAAAAYHSIVIYVFSYLTVRYAVINHDGKNVDLWSYGAILFHLSVLVVNLKLWMMARYHTVWFVLSVVLSVLVYVAGNVLYSAVYIPLDGDVLGTYTRLLWSTPFWALNVLASVAALAPDLLARALTDGVPNYSSGRFRDAALTVFTTRL